MIDNGYINNSQTDTERQNKIININIKLKDINYQAADRETEKWKDGQIDHLKV